MKSISFLPKSIIAFIVALLLLQVAFQGFFLQFDSFTQFFLILIFGIQVTLIVTLIPALLALFSHKISEWIQLILFPLVLFSHFLLLLYLDQTGILLGADLFGYSLSDITHTVESSSSFSILPWTLLAFSFAVFFGLRKLLRPIPSPFWLFILIGSGVLSIILPSDPPKQQGRTEAYFYQTKNPSSYFWRKTSSYFLGKLFTLNVVTPDFPFLRKIDSENAFAQWIGTKENPPHIIMIAVEGLGSDFLSEIGPFAGATPFLDSLANMSLYWPNCLSNTGRTFGVLPSLTASLPYGSSGFMDLKDHMPDHYSLFSLLQPVYHSSFFYGGNASFDNQSLFLRYNGINYLGDESIFPKDWPKLPGNEEGFSWGYGDKELFRLGLQKLKTFPKKPKLSFFMTITTHEPFISPEPEYLDVALKNVKNKKVLNDYPGVFTCLAYTDDAIHQFINDYTKTDDYQNSIIIITGDHRLIPVPADYRFDRFKVPLIIHSPLIENPKKSEQIITHSQVFPSLVGYLKKNFQIDFPDKISSIAPAISPVTSFGGEIEIGLMRNKNEMEEYVSGSFLLSEGELFKILDKLKLKPLRNDSILSELKMRLSRFDQNSKVALENNQLVEEKDFKPRFQFYDFSVEEKQIINSLFEEEKGLDTLYMIALDLARAKQYDSSRLILQFGLNQDPDYHDLRILLARTYGWQGNFDFAISELNQVMDKTDNQEDVYVTFADLYFWRENQKEEQLWIEKGLNIFPGSVPLLTRKARNLFLNNQKVESKEILENIIKNDPENELANQIYSWHENTIPDVK